MSAKPMDAAGVVLDVENWSEKTHRSNGSMASRNYREDSVRSGNAPATPSAVIPGFIPGIQSSLNHALRRPMASPTPGTSTPVIPGSPRDPVTGNAAVGSPALACTGPRLKAGATGWWMASPAYAPTPAPSSAVIPGFIPRIQSDPGSVLGRPMASPPTATPTSVIPGLTRDPVTGSAADSSPTLAPRRLAVRWAAAVTLPLLLATPALATDYPLTIENCGTSVTFAAPPERVVTIKSTATELLLALGLGDRIVGTGFQDGPVPPQWAPETALPVLSDRVPSQEVVLEAEPDFVYGGWESAFAADGAGTRDSLQALGVATYVAPTACRSEGTPDKLTFDDVFDQILEMGRIFDVEDRAVALVDEQRAMLEAIEPASGLTGLWYSSATATPYVGAGLGGPQMTMEALGIANIFADVPDTWTSASWEAVVDQDPDVLILVDAAWNSVDQKIALLADNPATANMSAVQNARYLTIAFPAAEPGIRSIPATADLARQLADLDPAP